MCTVGQAALITELLVRCWDALFCAAPQAYLRCIGSLPQPLGPHERRLVALGAIDLMDALPRLPRDGVQALRVEMCSRRVCAAKSKLSMRLGIYSWQPGGLRRRLPAPFAWGWAPTSLHPAPGS